VSAVQPTLVYDADFEEVGDRGRAERENRGPIAAAPHLHPLFAATLVNQVTPPEIVYGRGYRRVQGPRAGIAVNLFA
jgi:hypothetical protein